jgi:hypothetical protein
VRGGPFALGPMMIRGDQGCDPNPAQATTDHSRENVPILAYSLGREGGQAYSSSGIIYQSRNLVVNRNELQIWDPQIGLEASDRRNIPASEPVATVRHPPAKDADGNGGHERP